MNNRKFLASFLAAAMMCGTLASCGDNNDSTADSKAEATTEATTEAATEAETEAETEAASEDEEVPTAAPVDLGDVQFEEPVVVEEGDAYLQIVNGDWWVQYTGAATDFLSYGATKVHINGNGEYTVGVSADTVGFRYDTSNGTDINSEFLPFGMAFSAVLVRGGATLYPNMSIEITAIRLDGEELPLTAKSFTCIDDAYKDDDLDDMRANIYNQWVSDLPEDAHDSTGNVKGVDGYAATIIDTNAFEKEWTTVEVDFTVSGIE